MSKDESKNKTENQESHPTSAKRKEEIIDEYDPEDILDQITLNAIDPKRPLEIEKIAPQLYVAKSFKENGVKKYRVDMDNTPACECSGFLYHEHCRHIRRIELLTGEYELPYMAKLMNIEFDSKLGTHITPDIQYASSTNE
mgnify:CR=1 FL=1